MYFPTPDNGAVSSATDYEQYTPDANGNVQEHRRRDGTVITYSYDALNLQTQGYGGATFAYDNFGRLTSATVDGRSTSFGYDGLGRQARETGSHGTLWRFFNAVGDRTRLVYPDGYGIKYVRNDAGDLAAITDDYGFVLLTNTLDNLGRVTQVARTAGPSESRQYGVESRPGTLSYWFSDSSKNVAFGYSYNLAGQVVSATTNNALYDWTAGSPGTTGYTSDGQNKYSMVGASGISYDGRANYASGGVLSFGYDALNRLNSVGTVSLTYDAIDRLYQVSGTATTRFAYDGVQIIAEYDSSGTLLRRFIPGDGLDNNTAWFEGSGTDVNSIRWLLPDGGGSVVAVSGSGGSTTLGINTFDEYGKHGPNNLGRFQFKGMPWIPEIGLYHVRARAYSPGLGRFMQPDPAGFIDGMNLYAFTENDPVNRLDPTGLDGIGDLGEGITIARRWPVFSPWFDFAVRVGGNRREREREREREERLDPSDARGRVGSIDESSGKQCRAEFEKWIQATAGLSGGAVSGALVGGPGGALAGAVAGGTTGFVTGSLSGVSAPGWFTGMVGAPTGAVSAGFATQAFTRSGATAKGMLFAGYGGLAGGSVPGAAGAAAGAGIGGIAGLRGFARVGSVAAGGAAAAFVVYSGLDLLASRYCAR